MRAADAIPSFDSFLSARGVEWADGFPTERFVDLVVDWYLQTHPAEDLISSKVDSLVFQWGVYSFTDEPPLFHYDVTRQFYQVRRFRIRQCRFTLLFEPTAELESIGAGNRWCEYPVDDIEEFRQFAKESPATTAVLGMSPTRIERLNAGV